MKLNREEKSWVLYDVANSAFTMLTATTIPILFRYLAEEGGVESADATGWWGAVTSAAVILTAVLAPLLGTVADSRGMKKKLFAAFLGVGLAGLCAMSAASHWAAYMLLFLVARVGYAAANVFYDSMITDICADERMDMLSSLGYAWGYIGSCVPFLVSIALVMFEPFGLGAVSAVQAGFLVTALWWGLLSIPLLRRVKQRYGADRRTDGFFGAFSRVFATMKKLKGQKKILYFILAYFCYIDGVYTIISMATTYGGELGISDTGMILALLLTQFVAFPFAILSGRLAGRFGALAVIRFFIFLYTGICVFGFFLQYEWQFWVLAVAVGLAQGGVQSLSRSYFGRIIPKEESNEYFGFFDIFGKFADFLGPLILSFCAFVFGSSRYGILALILLFAAGYLLLRAVPDAER